LEELPPNPTWWPEINVDYTNSAPASNSWLFIKNSEHEIEELVDKGDSSSQQRRKLLKYISAFRSSGLITSNQCLELDLKSADLYSRLGEHQRAAKVYKEIAEQSPEDWVPLRGLAQEYERTEEKKDALQVYNRVDKLLRTDGNYPFLGAAVSGKEIIQLSGKTPSCHLDKPKWWDQFAQPPEWLTNTANALSPITSFQDGVLFVSSSLKARTDQEARIRACTALQEFPATTVNEKEAAITMLALAYDTLGDHHRAIVSAWKCIDQFSCDRNESVKQLKFIAKEFEKLNEVDSARQVLSSIPCFSSQ
jgi:tetratricopeptide (TPR) repeat protein